MELQSSLDFLFVKPGDYVAIQGEESPLISKRRKMIWIGQVISCIGGARDPYAWTLFQVMDIDSGEIIVINADSVEMILKPSKIENT